MSRAASTLEDSQQFAELCRLYARHAPDVALGSGDPAGPVAELTAVAGAHARLAARRPPLGPVVDVHAQDATGTVLVDLIDDEMPMLVDSVLACVKRVGREVRQVVHAMVVVRRAPTGELVEVLASADPGRPPLGSGVEAWIRLALDPAQPDEETDLAVELTGVLAAVRAVTEDGARIVDAALALAAELDGTDGTGPAESGEVAHLLRWLARGNFVFLGHLLQRIGRGRRRGLHGSGLGVLRDAGPHAAPSTAEPPLVVLTRADAPSRVLRAEHPYDVVVRFDGNVHRFVGMFTSAALHDDVLDTPLIGQRVRAAIRMAGLPVESYVGQRMLAVIAGLPRAELFWSTAEDLHDTAVGALTLTQGGRLRLRLSLHREPYGRFFSCLVHLPPERYSPQVTAGMQRVLLRELDGWRIDHTVTFGEPGPVLVHFRVQVDPATPDPDRDRLQHQLAAAILSWDDWVLQAAGGADGVAEQLAGLPPGYQDHVDPLRAVADLRRLRELGDEPYLELVGDLGEDGEQLRFRLFRAGAPVSLSAVLPVLQSLGVEVLDERPFEIVRPDRSRCWIYDFGLSVDAGARRAMLGRGMARCAEMFCAAFRAAWSGSAETDRFNALVLRTGLDWPDVAVLRAYAHYGSQLGRPFGRDYVAEILLEHPAVARALVALFHARFDPALPAEQRAQRSAAALATATALIDEVSGLDADRVLRGHLTLITATTRTSFYRRLPQLSFKIDPAAVPDMPAPRPRFEIFVYAPRVQGVHLRFGPVARGGLRWSDRRQDYRTEVLGLVKAQAVKNAVIVPVGAKGGFVVQAAQPSPAEVQACYRMFVSGLLDVTDNLLDGAAVAPPDVVRHDGDDGYLVVAADKGTARFSDVANEVAAGYGFWLGDAFASGGSVGYDHKAMGITARGAWESVRRHFHELGVDTDAHDFTAVGVGDMSGDVFGNGMLLSRHIKLLAAFDHRHVFVDPDPDPGASFAERARLFALPQSSWADYDRDLISAGGGVWPRTAKAVPIGQQIRSALGLDDAITSLSAPELIRAALAAPVDLLWNGGIGTYVKATGETHADAGDKANDAIRLDGARLRAKIVGEGGNLGLTQRGRIEFARAGGRINTDAIDNSAGVDCSDHEVNIKILLDRLVAAGELDRPGRNKLLAAMTDQVAQLVLAHNRAQNRVLGIARTRAPSQLAEHAALITALAERTGLDRALEGLPDPEQIAERAVAGQGLSSPELAVLLAHTKLDLKTELLRSDVPDLPEFAGLLAEQFPAQLADRFPAAVAAHPLRREILATALVNELVDRGGITFAHRLRAETGASGAEVVRSFATAAAIFDLPQLWTELEALPVAVPAPVGDEITLATRRLLDLATRWLLGHRPRPTAVRAEIDRLGPLVGRLLPRLPALLRGHQARAAAASAAELVHAGIPEAIAVRAAGLDHAAGLLDVIEVAVAADGHPDAAPIEEVARLYFALAERWATPTGPTIAS